MLPVQCPNGLMREQKPSRPRTGTLRTSSKATPGPSARTGQHSLCQRTQLGKPKATVREECRKRQASNPLKEKIRQERPNSPTPSPWEVHRWETVGTSAGKAGTMLSAKSYHFTTLKHPVNIPLKVNKDLQFASLYITRVRINF